jgi:ElaA protein
MYGDGSVTDKVSISVSNSVSKVALVTELHVAGFAELDIVTLYAILRLRSDVFVVEQDCAYSDVDGRDVEPGTRHLWLTATDGVVEAEPAPSASRRTGEFDDAEATNTTPRILAYLRILDDPDGTARIGRVCVARDARRAGHAATLMAAALDLIGTGRDAVLDAQAYTTRLYEDAGFVRDGEEFLDDGIMHVPMRRPAQ